MIKNDDKGTDVAFPVEFLTASGAVELSDDEQVHVLFVSCVILAGVQGLRHRLFFQIPLKCVYIKNEVM